MCVPAGIKTYYKDTMIKIFAQQDIQISGTNKISEKESSVYFFFFIFGCAVRHAGSQFPEQRSKLCPLHWKQGVLTTGPPGKSQNLAFICDKGSVSNDHTVQQQSLGQLLNFGKHYNCPCKSPKEIPNDDINVSLRMLIRTLFM